MNVRLRLAITGTVQGVGFRPFVFRLAERHGLAGSVRNTPYGAEIEVEGARIAIEVFRDALRADLPPLARIAGMEETWLDPAGRAGFCIEESAASAAASACILPDIATCAECRAEIFDPGNRRHRYPFTNCTHCGPRFSIITALPYDRARTTMRGFTMCPACRAEYDDPRDRRFHAQPNACPACGPQLSLLDGTGRPLASRDAALRDAAAAIQDGFIVALKGIGGFQLLVAAGNRSAVARLRERKRREEKPFALMLPHAEMARDLCRLSPDEERLLASPESPIVLLVRLTTPASLALVAANVAPGNPRLGVMLPYSPLHHLLMAELQAPVVMTSGNLSDEPLCIGNEEACARLAGIADLFLVHDRPVERPVDDSVAAVVRERELILRRARGYAPLPVPLAPAREPVLALGAEMKNTVTLALAGQAFVSQHIGDLQRGESHGAFRRIAADLCALYGVRPRVLVCDAHPDYLSTTFAHASDAGLVEEVQHHHAHIAACMVENELAGEVLGIAWDGTGYGADGTIWGGEFLLATRAAFRRFGHFSAFPLPGGDRAAAEPRRSALGWLYAALGGALWEREDVLARLGFAENELSVLRRMLEEKVNAPLTSSVGRLFDAVAALVLGRRSIAYEGQAAMELEYAAGAEVEGYPVALRDDGNGLTVDTAPLARALLADLDGGAAAPLMAARFHAALVEAAVAVALRAGNERVCLSGGCFQNRRLVTALCERLEAAGLRPYTHQRVPPNDGGISLGQAAVACARTAGKT